MGRIDQALFDETDHYKGKPLKSVDNVELGPLSANGLSKEVNSGGELFKALRVGFRPDQIIFNGTSKSDEEIEIMQRAADIAAEAHVEAMKSVRSGMKEYEVEAMLEHFFRRHGA